MFFIHFCRVSSSQTSAKRAMVASGQTESPWMIRPCSALVTEGLEAHLDDLARGDRCLQQHPPSSTRSMSTSTTSARGAHHLQWHPPLSRLRRCLLPILQLKGIAVYNGIHLHQQGQHLLPLLRPHRLQQRACLYIDGT